jgi:hypothetical protein
MGWRGNLGFNRSAGMSPGRYHDEISPPGFSASKSLLKNPRPFTGIQNKRLPLHLEVQHLTFRKFTISVTPKDSLKFAGLFTSKCSSPV